MNQPTSSTLLPGPGSTSQLMVAAKASMPEMTALPAYPPNPSSRPVSAAPQSRNESPRPVPAALLPGSARDLSSISSQDLGIPADVAATGVAATSQHRRSTSGQPQDNNEASRVASPESRVLPLPSPQSPTRAFDSSDPRFLLHRGQSKRTEGGVSDFSDGEEGGDRDLDEMSSVSSFNEDSPRSPRGPTRFQPL
jgi:hypothetical protein